MVYFALGYGLGVFITFLVVYFGYRMGEKKMCQDCERLLEQLHLQEYEMYGLKRRIIRLRSELKKERREKEKILKEKQQNAPQHYKNARKKGFYGRKG